MELFFKLILTYSPPIECHFNHYLAKQSFELKGLSRWMHHLSWTAVSNFFPSAGFKFEILSTFLYKYAILFQSWNYKE